MNYLEDAALEEAGYFVLDFKKQPIPPHTYQKLFHGEDRGWCGFCGLKPEKCPGDKHHEALSSDASLEVQKGTLPHES